MIHLHFLRAFSFWVDIQVDGCGVRPLRLVLSSMKLRVGILGCPNVGKSSLFNALARQSIAEAANFPFCTIDPNVCRVPLWDPMLEAVGHVGQSEKIVPASMEWVDVAGLAKNAHRGEGLGNQFLGTLRSCSCLCHVVRAFEDPQVIHVDGRVDPLEDLESIQLELLLADQFHVERRLESNKKGMSELEQETLRIILEGLQEGIPARTLSLSQSQQLSIRSMGLLTLKPVMYAWNVDEVDLFLDRNQAEERARSILGRLQHFEPNIDKLALVSAKVESELSQDSNQEQVEYLASIGYESESTEETPAALGASFCHQILPNLAAELLGYSIVYTGPGVPEERSKTTKAHLILTASSDAEGQVDDNGSKQQPKTAYDLAGRIHGEIQKGFLRAEVLQASELINFADWREAKEQGMTRIEGRDYLLKDRDVALIKWKG